MSNLSLDLTTTAVPRTIVEALQKTIEEARKPGVAPAFASAGVPRVALVSASATSVVAFPISMPAISPI